MKKNVFLLIIIMWGISLYSQNQFKYALKFGLNSNIPINSLDEYKDEDKFVTTFSPYLGLNLHYPIIKNFFISLQPNIYYYPRRLNVYSYSSSFSSNTYAGVQGYNAIKNLGLKIPILIGFKFNDKLSLKLGPSFYLFSISVIRDFGFAEGGFINPEEEESNVGAVAIVDYRYLTYCFMCNFDLFNLELSFNKNQSEYSLYFDYKTYWTFLWPEVNIKSIVFGISYSYYFK